MLGYVIIYLLLIIFCIGMRMGSEEIPLYDKYGGCVLPAHICTCILSAFPMLFLASEMIESEKHPYMLVYAFRWGRRDNVLCHLLSLVFPAVLFILIGILYWGVNDYNADAVGGLGRNGAYHLTAVFVLSALAFLIAMLTRNMLVSLLCVLAYTIVMLFMDVSESWFNVIALGDSIAFETIPWMISWLIAGVIFNETGLWIYRKNL